MSRLASTFTRVRQQGRRGLVTYVTAGDPDLARSEEILLALDDAGASVIEVGVPFSDPVADGPVIQQAAERALAGGTTLSRVLELVARVRPRVAAPVVLFTYVNPLLRLGVSRFTALAAEAGVDGVLTLDVPVEEAGELRQMLANADIDMIFLISPTTSAARIRTAAGLGSGFLYAISRLGVTGARRSLPEDVSELVGRIRAESTLPVALGFGISHPDQVREACRSADAAVVGSSLVSVIAEAARQGDLVGAVRHHVRWLLGNAGSEQRATDGNT